MNSAITVLPTANASVSIVMPVHGRARLTEQCLSALLPTLLAGCEVIVVDDASTDSTPALLASYGDSLRVLTLAENVGYARACNAGAALAAHELLLFLNNDTRPLPGWLQALTGCAEAHPAAEVLGAKLLYPTGSVQHAGVVIGQDGYPHNLYAGLPADHPAVNHSRALQAVTGACLLVRRSAFQRVGGFDDAYLNSLEDVDLCLRIGERGGEVRYCHEAVLVHLESASRGRRGSFERSVRRYRERWRERVRRDDLSIYAEDGLLEVEYTDSYPVRLAVSPCLAVVDAGRESEIESLLHAYARQVSDLLAEVVRLSAISGVELSPQLGYRGLVRRVGEAVAQAALPPGASVLVLSKGDAALLELPGLAASHFPQDATGDYAGHYPADSAAAVAHLRELQAQGAEYLVIPATASWWLDHYTGLAEHLASHGQVVADAPGACQIHALQRRGAEAPAAPASEGPHLVGPHLSVAQMRDYLEHLIPADSRVVVLEDAGVAAELAPLPTIALAPHELSPASAAGARDALVRLATRGADYLVVPRTADEWLQQHAHVAESIQTSCREVADQRHLCRVFELKGLTEHV